MSIKYIKIMMYTLLFVQSAQLICSRGDEPVVKTAPEAKKTSDLISSRITTQEKSSVDDQSKTTSTAGPGRDNQSSGKVSDAPTSKAGGFDLTAPAPKVTTEMNNDRSFTKSTYSADGKTVIEKTTTYLDNKTLTQTKKNDNTLSIVTSDGTTTNFTFEPKLGEKIGTTGTATKFNAKNEIIGRYRVTRNSNDEIISKVDIKPIKPMFPRLAKLMN